MKVERVKNGSKTTLHYHELISGRLYIDVSDPHDTDVYLSTDEGVASLDTGAHYSHAGADEDEFPNSGLFVEVGGKAVIND